MPCWKKQRHCECIKTKLEQQTPKAIKSFARAVKRKSMYLAEEHRFKRRKPGTGRKRKLDSDAEDFIVQCIEHKGDAAAHGRRHDSVIYCAKRMKYDDLFDEVNNFQESRNKETIKSSSTIRLLSKPRKKNSRQSKFHHGRGLFCTRKPPKSGCQENENTHYQRSHVKLLKEDMFMSSQAMASMSLLISMDDKATVKPGTDIGFKGARKQVILEPTDLSRARLLPQHDFPESKVSVTPGSLRYMTKQIDETTNNLMRKDDQSVVVIRPKHYVGSSGSVWASDQMHIYHSHPHLYEEPSEDVQRSTCVKKLAACVKDYATYFLDTYDKDDVIRVEKKQDGIHKAYEVLRLESFIHGISESIQRFNDSGEEHADSDEQSLLQELNECLQSALSVREQMLQCTGKKLIELYKPICQHCESIINACTALHLPQIKSIIGELTDAGPGVGVSNYEVTFRMTEMSRIHNTLRRTRVHRSRDDSGQNESERTNACIGEALVDGGSMTWEFHRPLDGKTQEEIDKLLDDEISKEEEICMEKNAWQVCSEIRERIHMEPGPAGDLLIAVVEGKKEDQFFYNTDRLLQFRKAGKEKRKSLPGYNYFNKISLFMADHTVRGELFMEYKIGLCTKGLYDPCKFCQEMLQIVNPCPQPYPDYACLPAYKYLKVNDTPTDNRSIDDFLPRAQLKEMFKHYKISSTNVEAINNFAEKFIVDAPLVVSYVQHLELLDLRKRKRAEERAAKRMKEKCQVEKEVAGDSSSDESSDEEPDASVEVVMAVIDSTSSEAEEEPPIRRTRRTTRTHFWQRKFFGDSD